MIEIFLLSSKFFRCSFMILRERTVQQVEAGTYSKVCTAQQIAEVVTHSEILFRTLNYCLECNILSRWRLR